MICNRAGLRRCAGLVLLWFAAGSIACARANPEVPAPRVVDGVIDLSQWDFETGGPVSLAGHWEFYWNVLKTSGDFADDSVRFIRTPGAWNGFDLDGAVSPGQGYATYRLTIRLPERRPPLALYIDNQNTAYFAYVDGRPLGGQGVVGRSATESVPHRDSLRRLAGETADQATMELIVHVSNYHDRIGGLTSTVYLGTEALLHNRPREQELFLIGAIAIIGLYHLALFVIRRKHQAALYFGLFCLTIVLRMLVTGERILVQEVPALPFWLYNRAEYLSFYAAVPLFALFQHAVFPGEFARRVLQAALAFAGLVCGFVLVTPAIVYDTWTLIPYEIFTLALILYAIFVLGLAVWRRRRGARLFALGFAALAAGVGHDIARTLDVIHTPYVAPYAFFFFIFAQSAMLARSFAAAFHRVEELSAELEASNAQLKAVNRSFERFVPGRFLDLLGKSSVDKIQLGDSSLRSMSVLFSDIRSFTTLSEAMSPEENFRFLNEYLQRMEPAIHRHGGFVDKFFGDAIMALFQNDAGTGAADRALAAALDMRAELNEYNARRRKNGDEDLDTGIGLNTGDMILGTVGSSNRLDTTVIGTTVNMASRLETLTAFFRAAILISDFTYKNLRELSETPMREIGAIRVRGRTEPVGVYEVFARDEAQQADLKAETAGDLLMGLARFQVGDFREAGEIFARILGRNADDHVARFYREQCRAYVAAPPAEEDWDGSIHMAVK